MPTDLPTHAATDPYPSVYILSDDDLKTVAQFVNVLRLQGNINNTGSRIGYLAWWTAIVKFNDHQRAMNCTQDALHEVKDHPFAREISRLILAAAEFFERMHGDGSAAVQEAVTKLRELGFEPVLKRRKI